MLASYLTAIWRRTRRHPALTLINVAGLAVGSACCLLIVAFVRFELAFDDFHAKADRIYRLNKFDTLQDGSTERHAVTSGLMGPALVDDFPEVEAAVRILPWFDPVVHSRETSSTRLSNVLFVDKIFFDVFDFSLLRGNPATALGAPMSIVLTPAAATALFGGEDPIGKSVVGLADESYTVTGIVQPAPERSHIQFDALISWSSSVPGTGPLEYHWMNNWLTQSLFTYVLLHPDADPASIEARLPDFMRRHFAERADQYELYLQPLRDVYLGSADVLYARNVRTGNRQYVIAFIAVGALVLFIAGANFVNLTTATARRRIVEVGVRKTLGASRRMLASQFIVESILTTVPAVMVAAVAVHLSMPYFRAFSARAIPFEVFEPAWLVGLLGTGILVGIIAGAYPGVLQSGFKPLRVLRGGRASARDGGLPRRILVTAQFAVSIALVVTTAVIYRQLDFVAHADLGFDADRIIVLNTGGTSIEHQYAAFTDQLRTHPDIIQVAAGKNVPGHGTMTFTLRPEGHPDDDIWTAPVQRIAGPEMLNTYGLRMARGRFFSYDRPSELRNGVVINEALWRRLGWEEPIGKRLDVQGELADGRVIGVVADFHFESLHRPIDPTVFIIDTTAAGYVSARIGAGVHRDALGFIEAQWKAFESRYPFSYTLLDDAFGVQYASERRLMTTIGFFALVAVFVACMGLFGLSAYLVEERTKEIGVRKVLGATVAKILILLSKETVGLVVAAFCVAAPVAYVVANRWLETFSYRIDITAWTLATAGAMVLLLAVATVSSQALRAATANPVHALRDE